MPTVTVACKLPHGIVAHLGETRVTFKGANSSIIAGGYGMTHGVDASFFEGWLKANALLPFVAKEMVFAMESPVDTAAMAEANASIKTGLERLEGEDMPAGVTMDADAPSAKEIAKGKATKAKK